MLKCGTKPEYVIYRSLSPGYEAEEFGDGLMAALLVSILNDNGIKAYLSYQKYVMDVVDCPKIYSVYERQGKQLWNFIYKPECIFDGRSIIQKSIDLFKEQNGIGKDIKITRHSVPVLFNEIDVDKFDVVLNTYCGKMGKYRRWPHFEELKKQLEENHVSFLDLDQNDIKGNLALNYVNKSKLYVGLDTGMSHYVSSVVNKSLIIQGGYVSIDHWSIYGYDYVEIDNIHCRDCCLKTFEQCNYDHFCMKKLSAVQVWSRIKDKLWMTKKI
jgi:hypothetical protein